MHAGALRRNMRVITHGGWRQLADAAAAQAELFAAQFLVSRRPVGRLLQLMASPAGEPKQVAVHQHVDAARIALAIGRAARYGLFRPRCLVRAVALQRALERRGIHGSVVRIGVRPQRGELLAHAWVEHGGVVLGDTTAHTSTFAVLTDARLAARAAERA